MTSSEPGRAGPIFFPVTRPQDDHEQDHRPKRIHPRGL